MHLHGTGRKYIIGIIFQKSRFWDMPIFFVLWPIMSSEILSIPLPWRPSNAPWPLYQPDANSFVWRHPTDAFLGVADVHLWWGCFLPIKSCILPAFLCIQVAALEQRKQRHPLNRTFLWECHRPGHPRQLCLPRKPIPVRCRVLFWEEFWLSTREYNTAIKYSVVGYVWNNFILLQTLKNTRSSIWKRNPSKAV